MANNTGDSEESKNTPAQLAPRGRSDRIKLTPQEEAARKEFVLGRLRNGFSFIETQRQFMAEYGYSSSAIARKWINRTMDEIAAIDNDPKKRRRIHTVIIEMYHAPITSYQTELLGIQRQIDVATSANKQRKELLLMLPKTPQNEIEELRVALETLPETPPIAMVGMLEAKTRARERMFRVISDLARLQGFGWAGDWKNALHVLLDNNLIPPQLAEQIINVIDDFDSNIRLTGITQPKALPPSDDDDDNDNDLRWSRLFAQDRRKLLSLPSSLRWTSVVFQAAALDFKRGVTL